jgi:hypothetical protein
MYNDPNQPQPPFGQPQPPQQPQEPWSAYGGPPRQPYDEGATQAAPPTYGQPQYGQPQYPPPQYGAPPTQPPPYGVPPTPAYAQQPQKKSRRWLWITLGIIGGIIALGCAGCAIATALGVNFFAQAVGPTVVAEQYYQAIQKQDYVTAYSYLASGATLTIQGQPVPVTQPQLFTAAAQALDSQLGPVSSHTLQPDGSNTSRITVVVIRPKKTYNVILTLVKVGNDWKIQNIDGGI